MWCDKGSFRDGAVDGSGDGQGKVSVDTAAVVADGDCVGADLFIENLDGFVGRGAYDF